MSFQQLKQDAKVHLQGNWGVAILSMVIFNLVNGIPQGIAQMLGENAVFLSNILSIISIVLLPLSVGLNKVFMRLANAQNPDVDTLFYGFKYGKYGRNLITLFVMNLFLVFWTLLLIIPGIIKSFSYAMTSYILADEDYDHIGGTEAITISRQLMDGHKMEYFILSLSFYWWLLIAIPVLVGLTLSGMILLAIALGGVMALVITFYIGPYFNQTVAEFYYNLRGPSATQEEYYTKEDVLTDSSDYSSDPLDWDFDEVETKNKEDDEDDPFYK